MNTTYHHAQRLATHTLFNAYATCVWLLHSLVMLLPTREPDSEAVTTRLAELADTITFEEPTPEPAKTSTLGDLFALVHEDKQNYLAGLTYRQLQQLCKHYKLRAVGKTNVLREQLEHCSDVSIRTCKEVLR